MKNTYCVIFVVVCISLSVLSCGDSLESDNADTFYFNSFENNYALSNWSGYGTRELRNDSPSGGGQYSLYISGGCDIPHAYLEFPELQRSCSLILKCFGKNLLNGGSISLRVKNKDDYKIAISVNDTTWKKYESGDTLVCEKGSRLRLELSSGGFIHSAMLIDAIEIKRVK